MIQSFFSWNSLPRYAASASIVFDFSVHFKFDWAQLVDAPFPTHLLEDEQGSDSVTEVIHAKSETQEDSQVKVTSYPSQFVQNTLPLVFSPPEKLWFLGMLSFSILSLLDLG